MNEEVFNIEIRKFLKLVGVTSQRIIEQSVREAVRTGRIAGTETLRVRMTLKVDEVNIDKTIEGSIVLE